MRLSLFSLALAATSFVGVDGLAILLTNDDSWASANIRAFYYALKAAGHVVLMVAPAVNQSGKGGTTVFDSNANLTTAGEFNTVAAGAPSYGFNKSDSYLWYYNGTPAACTFFALDYVWPLKFGNGSKPDLVVSGPNEGNNAGPFLYTLSGTIGATYAGVERGIPGIAFSAGNGTHRSYTTINGTNDVAILNANSSVSIVNQLGGSVKAGSRLLPLGYGLNVNLPVLNSTCSKPGYVFSRLTGGAIVDKAVLNLTSGIATYGNDVNDPGLNTCVSGNCSLPGETNVILGCSVAISVFTVDYDAPNATTIQGQLSPLFGH